MSYPGLQPQQQPTIRPSRAWIVVGSLLMVASFFAFVIVSAIGIVNFANEMTDLTEVAPGDRVQMELEAKRYLVYTEGYQYEAPAVSITGGSEGVHVYESDITNESWQGSTYYSSNFEFTIEVPGTYVISNAGTDMVAVGSQDFGQLGRSVGLGFLVGTLLGVPGFIMIVVTLVRRRNARKQLRLATGTYSGVPYNQTPGPYGTSPTGSPGTPPPGFGSPPAGPSGTPPPPPPPPPGTPPPGRWPQ